MTDKKNPNKKKKRNTEEFTRYESQLQDEGIIDE